MGKPEATFRDRSLKPSGFQVSLGPNALVPDAVCLLVCCAYLVRMSEPYLSDIVDRIICYFLFLFLREQHTNVTLCKNAAAYSPHL